MNAPESPDDRLLREWLAREAPPPLPDADFTRRVLAALPPPRPRQDWRTAAGTLAGAVIGLAVVALSGGTVDSFIAAANRLADGLAANATLSVAVGVGLVFLAVEAASPPLPSTERRSRN